MIGNLWPITTGPLVWVGLALGPGRGQRELQRELNLAPVLVGVAQRVLDAPGNRGLLVFAEHRPRCRWIEAFDGGEPRTGVDAGLLDQGDGLGWRGAGAKFRRPVTHARVAGSVGQPAGGGADCVGD